MRREKSAGEWASIAAAEKARIAMRNADTTIEKLRLHVVTKGLSGMLNISRYFRRMDRDGRGQLETAEFRRGLNEIGFSCSDRDATELFIQFDTDGSGKVNLEEFLNQTRPQLNAKRKDLVMQAYNKLAADKSDDDEITVEPIKKNYCTKTHDSYRNGDCTEEELLQKFLRNFEMNGSAVDSVTKEEWIDYYSGVSAAHERDGNFDLIVRSAWKI